MADLPIHRFDSFDGTPLAWREMGEGRAILLLHGLFSNAVTNWVRYGHAAAIAARGMRVIMPDLRAHGDSGRPHDAAAYPADVLARDGLALIDRLGLTDYDLGGYSLGARTVVRMLALGAAPRRVVLAGMGYEGLIDTGARGAFFRRVLSDPDGVARGTAEWSAAAFLKTTGGDAAALLPLLDSFIDTPPDQLTAMARPTLVLAGADDHDNGSAARLAEVLPNADCRAIPGTHMSAVLKPDLGRAIADFLAA